MKISMFISILALVLLNGTFFACYGPIVGFLVAWMNAMIVMGGLMMAQQKKWGSKTTKSGTSWAN